MRLTLSVLGRGPGSGTAETEAGGEGDGMGLSGLVDRVESLGVRFETRNRPGGGAELQLILDIGEGAV